MSERFSFLVSLYGREDPDYLGQALASMVEQTVLPDEIVLVLDGPIPAGLSEILSEFAQSNPGLLKTVPLAHNVGLGQALAVGMTECKNDLVARMDTDDIAMPARMEKTLAAFAADPDLALVGTQVLEFVDDVNKPMSATDLPTSHEEIVAFSKRRCPMRHPSITFRKQAVLAAGNYRGGYLYFEDWDVLNRMFAQGAKSQNLDEVLLAVRVSPDFYGRRGGLGYLRHMMRFKREQLRCGYFSSGEFVVSAVPHAVVCVLPNKVRAFIYKKLLRKKARV